MIKYLTLVSALSLGILSGCQGSYTVTKYEGKVLDIDNVRAEIVYKTSDGNYKMTNYNLDFGQRDELHIGQKIECYVRDNGYIQEISKE